MGFVSLILVSTYVTTLKPFDRAQLALENSSGIQSTLVVTLGGTESVSGTFSCANPNLQRIHLKNSKSDSEFLQTSEAVIKFDHTSQSYSWYPRYKVPITPPDDASAFVLFGLPDFMSKGTLKKMGPESAWDGLDRKEVNGHMTDVIGLRDPGVKGSYALKLFIDQNGKILSFVRQIQTDAEPLICKVVFQKITYSMPNISTFEPKIPWGYVPDRQPLVTDLKVIGETIEPCRGQNLKSQKFEPLPLKGRNIIVFTSNDLRDESKLDWENLEKECRRYSVRLTTVWLGSKPSAAPGEWTFWDSKGDIELATGAPFTPYIMSVEDGVVVSGWQGWEKEDEKEAIKNLMAPFLQD